MAKRMFKAFDHRQKGVSILERVFLMRMRQQVFRYFDLRVVPVLLLLCMREYLTAFCWHFHTPSSYERAASALCWSRHRRVQHVFGHQRRRTCCLLDSLKGRVRKLIKTCVYCSLHSLKNCLRKLKSCVGKPCFVLCHCCWHWADVHTWAYLAWHCMRGLACCRS